MPRHSPLGRHNPRQTPPFPRRRPLQWTVCILLECILVTACKRGLQLVVSAYRGGLHPGVIWQTPRNSKSGRYASYWNAFLFQIIMVDCISSHYVLYSSERNIPNKNLSESRRNFIRLAIIFYDLFGLRFSYFKNLSVSTAVLSLEIIALIISNFSRASLGHFGNFHSPKI